ncbi:MAG: acetyl-CoA decarbonylase/synthase complex subunit gamma [Nitrospirota bacterium]|jgi:acetyl-CoA decarbonylase/synthase complex subunit gamma
MALTGVQIFKLLPKTNCKKCGYPTCLAFAMKLAQRQASIEDCPDVSEEAKRTLGEEAAPPIRPVTIGMGEKAVTMGEEMVLFRHDKKFFHPTVYAVQIKDTAPEADAAATIDEVLASEMERVGQHLRIDALYLSNESGESAPLEALVKLAAEKAPGFPLIIAATDASVASEALAYVEGSKPLLFGANAENLESMCRLAREKGASLGLVAKSLEEASELTEKAKAHGVEDLVIDPGARKAGEILRDNTLMRRAALKKNFKPLGYPILTPVQRDDEMLETLVATVGVCKYSSIVVLSSVKKWKSLALFALRQNIYTDPQVPMQVEQKVYNIGEPDGAAPLMITTNFSLTYFIVAGEVENSKVPSRLAVMDCEGLSVLTAWAAGKFTATKIAQFIKESGVENEVANKELIIPGYVAILSGALEDKLEGWKITVGPREANAIPAFLKSR